MAIMASEIDESTNPIPIATLRNVRYPFVTGDKMFRNRLPSKLATAYTATARAIKAYLLNNPELREIQLILAFGG